MDKNDIIGFLKENRAFLEKEFQVKSIALFGSWARGDQDENSDIDILVELNKQEFSLWAKLKLFLESHFKRKVDLVTYGKHLSDRFLKQVQKNAVYV